MSLLKDNFILLQQRVSHLCLGHNSFVIILIIIFEKESDTNAKNNLSDCQASHILPHQTFVSFLRSQQTFWYILYIVIKNGWHSSWSNLDKEKWSFIKIKCPYTVNQEHHCVIVDLFHAFLYPSIAELASPPRSPTCFVCVHGQPSLRHFIGSICHSALLSP